MARSELNTMMNLTNEDMNKLTLKILPEFLKTHKWSALRTILPGDLLTLKFDIDISYELAKSILEQENPNIVEKHKCHCDNLSFSKYGCRCGGI